jgi:hypothetical protein
MPTGRNSLTMALDLGIATRETWPCPLPQLMRTATSALLKSRDAEQFSTDGVRSHHGRREGEQHRCPGCLAPVGRYSRGLTRVSLASLVMASSFPCCEIRQLLVHVYPGGSKAPGAERITVFYGRRGCLVNKPRFMPAGQHRRLRVRPWPAFRSAGRHRGADRDARNPRTLATGHTMTAAALPR